MKDENKTKKQLINELSELRKRNAELEKAVIESNHIKETLITSEEHFHSIAKSVTDAIITVDINANIVFWNKAAEVIFGYTADEVINKPLTIIMPQRLHASDMSGFKKAVLIGDSPLLGMYIEGTMLTKEDLEFPVEISRSIWKTSKDIFVTAIVRDITERKKAEEEVRKVKDSLDNIIESSLEGIIVSDSIGYVTRVNNSFLKLIGYNEEALIGKHISELTPYEEGTYDSTTGEMVEIDKNFIVDATKIAGNKLFEEGKISNWNSYYLRKDGKIVPVESNIAYLYNDEGETIGTIGVSRDITERRQIEKALRESHQELEEKVEKRTATLKLTNEQLQQEIISRKQAEEKLRDSEERARSLLNAPVDIALLIDNKYNILDCNESFIKRFNKSKDELVGSCALDLFTMEVAKSRKERIDKLIQTGKAIYFEDQHRGRWFDSFIHPIFDSQGNVTKVAVFARDTTESKQIEEKLIEYQNRLRALTSQMTLTEEKERKRFAEYLHDQIGQQLFVLKLKLEELTKRASSNDTYEDLDNGLKITDQLIKDARSLTFELSPPILYQLGLGAALEWLIEQTEKQYSIMVTFEDDKQEKPIDEDIKILLFQAVRELLTNIAKHAQAQKAKVSIKRDNSIIRVCVEDEGVGFTPPKTILDKGKITGFGLFSIKERLEQLGGNLEIESILGRGTQITLVAPLESKNRRSNIS